MSTDKIDPNKNRADMPPKDIKITKLPDDASEIPDEELEKAAGGCGTSTMTPHEYGQ